MKMVDIMLQGLYFELITKYGLYYSFKKVQLCSRSSRIFQRCTLIKLWRFAFAFPVYFKTSSWQTDCTLPIALVQWSITNVPSAADNLEHHEAQNEAKIYFKLELWTWDEALQEQVVKSLVQPSAGSSTTAGRGRQDMGRWWPVTRMAPFNSVGVEEPAYRLWTSHRHNA